MNAVKSKPERARVFFESVIPRIQDTYKMQALLERNPVAMVMLNERLYETG
jgi:hypothetical protein